MTDSRITATACNILASRLQLLIQPLIITLKTQVYVLSVRVFGIDWTVDHTAISIVMLLYRCIHSNAYYNKSIVTSAPIVTRRGNVLFSLLSDNCRRVSEETQNMLHCSLLKAARPEQPPGTAPVCLSVAPSFSTGGAAELGRRRR
jgi:hypothetical protein